VNNLDTYVGFRRIRKVEATTTTTTEFKQNEGGVRAIISHHSPPTPENRVSTGLSIGVSEYRYHA